jgi:hypothetical protein
MRLNGRICMQEPKATKVWHIALWIISLIFRALINEVCISNYLLSYFKIQLMAFYDIYF